MTRPRPLKTLRLFRGGRAWGIESGGTLYDAMFLKRTAQRIAEIYEDHEFDYETTKDFMLREGFKENDFRNPNEPRS